MEQHRQKLPRSRGMLWPLELCYFASDVGLGRGRRAMEYGEGTSGEHLLEDAVGETAWTGCVSGRL